MRKVRLDLKKIYFFKESPRLNCTLYSIVTHHFSVIALVGLLKIVKKKTKTIARTPERKKRTSTRITTKTNKPTNQQTKRKP